MHIIIARLIAESSFVGEDEQPKQHQKVALITLNEWSRIQDKLAGVNEKRDEAIKRQEKKKARHQMSLATVKNWGNTIEVS